MSWNDCPLCGAELTDDLYDYQINCPGCLKYDIYLYMDDEDDHLKISTEYSIIDKIEIVRDDFGTIIRDVDTWAKFFETEEVLPLSVERFKRMKFLL